jgi:hexosaminidase
VQILGQRTRNLWPFEEDGDAFVFQLPKEPLDAAATVVAVDLAEPLEVAVLPVISAPDEMFVGSLMVAVGQMGDSKVSYRYTTDGGEPTAQSTPAGKPFTLRESATVKARGFVAGRPVTRTVERRFERLVPLPAVQAFKSDPGLAYAAFEVPSSIKSCADITNGKKAGEGVAEAPSVAVKPREENFGLVFTGFIEVPASGLYRFFVDSDDGSTMSIQGKTVVDNDGLHSATEKSGAIALEQGLHPVEIRMFEAAGQDLLRVSWTVPGAARKSVVPAAAWKH